jgi:hypothetical protein
MVDLQIVEPKTEGISGSESLRGKSSKKTKKKSFEQSDRTKIRFMVHLATPVPHRYN